jgi:hypothetical protein
VGFRRWERRKKPTGPYAALFVLAVLSANFSLSLAAAVGVCARPCRLSSLVVVAVRVFLSFSLSLSRYVRWILEEEEQHSS